MWFGCALNEPSYGAFGFAGQIIPVPLTRCLVLTGKRESTMKALKTHVAGVDVHKEILAITVLIGSGDEDPKEYQFECSTFTDDLKAMGLKFKELGVTDVAMESTGVYWKPVHNVWDPMGFEVVVGN